MSRAAFVALFVGLFASGLEAQEQRDLARRLDSVNAVAAAAHAALVAYERQLPLKGSTGGPPLRIDTSLIADGKIRILLNVHIGPTGRASAARADSNLLRMGKALAVFPPMVFTINGDSTLHGRDDRVSVGYRPPEGGSVNSSEPYDPARIAHWIVDKALMVGLARTQTDFSKWQRGRLPVDRTDLQQEPDWRIVRLNLLSSPSFLGRRCYAGDIMACAKFVGLRADPDPVRSWYDSAARLSAVKEHREVAMRDQASATAHCLQGSDSACAVALWAINVFVRPPGDDQAIETVVREAVLAGGDGAIERLVTSGGSAETALAAAAKLPLDSVLARWRAKIHGDLDHSRDLTVGLALVTLLWIALLLLSASRTSRWP